MKYITIDGDDIGRQITAKYLSNDESGLRDISSILNNSVKKISVLLEREGFSVIFCAADGVLAKTDKEVDFYSLFLQIQTCGLNGLTFSAGVGDSLSKAYVALLESKCNGKNMIRVDE